MLNTDIYGNPIDLLWIIDGNYSTSYFSQPRVFDTYLIPNIIAITKSLSPTIAIDPNQRKYPILLLLVSQKPR